MKIRTQDYNNVTVIELGGELEGELTEHLKRTVTEAIGKGRKAIVIDMNGVGFIDSSGLEELLWSRDYCNENKCELRLAGLDENCRKILEITRLSGDFESYPELSEAVRSFA